MLLMEKLNLYNKTYQQLDSYLTRLRQYWQFEAFHHNDYPWGAENPDLSHFLDGISDQTLVDYQQNPEALFPQLSSLIEGMRALNDPLFTVKALVPTEKDHPFWLSNGIKGRKWSQISAFSEQVNDQHSIVEWCAGKGHLGRLINWHKKTPVLSIEWQQILCEQGAQEANKMQLSQRFKQADVLKGQADSDIKESCHAIALHACGDLHLRLIKLAKQHKPSQLTISPCCYHLTEQTHYKPCSEQGRASQLILSRANLKLAVNKLTTAGKRQSRLSEQEVLWRLAFDELQKFCLSTTTYLPLPSFPKKLLSGEFIDFVIWAQTTKSLTFVLPLTLQPFLDSAEVRLKKVRRMELISQFFVRPLELWLVYDRALSLQESGYQVTLSTFCDELTTPRNLMIQARLTGDKNA